MFKYINTNNSSYCGDKTLYFLPTIKLHKLEPITKFNFETHNFVTEKTYQLSFIWINWEFMFTFKK